MHICINIERRKERLVLSKKPCTHTHTHIDKGYWHVPTTSSNIVHIYMVSVRPRGVRCGLRDLTLTSSDSSLIKTKIHKKRTGEWEGQLTQTGRTENNKWKVHVMLVIPVLTPQAIHTGDLSLDFQQLPSDLPERHPSLHQPAEHEQGRYIHVSLHRQYSQAYINIFDYIISQTPMECYPSEKAWSAAWMRISTGSSQLSSLASSVSTRSCCSHSTSSEIWSFLSSSFKSSLISLKLWARPVWSWEKTGSHR